ncbi:hypothetical protein [Pyxidicoccus xibeiensis]|uniref:hypothetical protein n=1 Tax=Pyxidicoccus xibeiensis TaxID=2906759 RepID=UPI00225DF5A0|nr:hypothetical protein [Pyxidicoccus xibeiensis]
MSRLARGFVALLLASLATCGDDSTSLFLRVDGADGATQLEVRGLRDGEPWFPAQRRPEQEGEPFSGEQSLRLRFNAPPDVPFVLEVDALSAGVPIARGSAEAQPRKGAEVELRLSLTPVTVEPLPDGGTPDGGADGGEPDAGDPDAGVPDAGVPDAGDPDAGEPDAGAPDAGTPDAGTVTCTTCTVPGGACVASTSAVACGGSGLACIDCTADGRANLCTTAGACSCGTQGRCGVGERCVNNACVCDRDTCDGCCQGNVCRNGDTPTVCGIDGTNCANCETSKSDNCVNGGCRCGLSEPCPLLSICQNGRCT